MPFTWTQEDEDAVYAESMRHYEWQMEYAKEIGWNGFPPLAKPPEPRNVAESIARARAFSGPLPTGYWRKNWHRKQRR